MIQKGSRYERTRRFQYAAHEPAPFTGRRPRALGRTTGVIEHTLREWDRLDLLALHYYNDPRRWWRILDANPEILNGSDLADPERVGTVILIPPADEPGGAR